MTHSETDSHILFGWLLLACVRAGARGRLTTGSWGRSAYAAHIHLNSDKSSRLRRAADGKTRRPTDQHASWRPLRQGRLARALRRRALHTPLPGVRRATHTPVPGAMQGMRDPAQLQSAGPARRCARFPSAE